VDKVYIELNDEQKQKLFSLQDKVAQAYEQGKTGAVLAQIHFTGRDAVIVCVFLSHEQTRKIQEITLPERDRVKIADDNFAKKALAKARN
jgi:hypothetical protein